MLRKVYNLRGNIPNPLISFVVIKNRACLIVWSKKIRRKHGEWNLRVCTLLSALNARIQKRNSDKNFEPIWELDGKLLAFFDFSMFSF